MQSVKYKPSCLLNTSINCSQSLERYMCACQVFPSIPSTRDTKATIPACTYPF
ncbi:unnamed protein product [Moneuplotes crassus]|uniref:Uncharacterized protein n=1 Tax=Euplotes crassus TaxID=5936 RepID=A0AAD2D5V6_EUPCR|nr:unnamed protein product [Moneuplotes crassus]